MIRQLGIKGIIWTFFFAGALVGLYFQFTYHKFLNNDTLAYINIAQLYAQGEWQQAINGCWSPLYSWLLAICDLVGIPLLPACYVVNFVAAGCCLHLAMLIGARFIKQSLFYYLFSFYSLVVLLFYSMSTLTPDLLSLACSCWFLVLVLKERFWWAGAAAALMYFAKLYNFVMLHLFFLVLMAWHLYQHQSIKWLAKTYGVFIAVSLVWITILSVHENKFTFSTTGRFTHNYVSPDYTGVYPLFNQLYAPPSPGAYSILIDPAHLLDEYDWSPFSSSRNFSHQMELVWNSVRYYYNILDNHRVKTALLVLGLGWLFYKRRQGLVKAPSLLVIFFLLYPVFYFPIFVIDRYVLVCLILFNFFFFYIGDVVTTHFNGRRVLQIALGVVAIGLIPLLISAKNKMAISAKEYAYYQDFHKQLPAMRFLQGQRVAADMPASLEVVQLCYYLQCRYFGTWTDGQPASLVAHRIRYYIAESASDQLPVLQTLQIGKSTLYIHEVTSAGSLPGSD